MEIENYTSSSFFKEKLKSMPNEKKDNYEKFGFLIDKTLKNTFLIWIPREKTVVFKIVLPILHQDINTIMSVGREIESYIQSLADNEKDLTKKIILSRFKQMFHNKFYMLSKDDNKTIDFAVYENPAFAKIEKTDFLRFKEKTKSPKRNCAKYKI